MNFVFVALVIYLAMNALAASMARHGDLYLMKVKHVPVSIWRWVGWFLMACSFSLCILFWGSSLGTIAWLALLTFSSLLVGLLFTYRESFVKPAVGGALLALVPAGFFLLV